MSVLKAVLDTQPSDWTTQSETDYLNSYLLKQVEYWTTEYDRVIEGCESYRTMITSIKRVQNPFQWGLFKIQEEKRRSEGSYAVSTTGFHVIHPSDLNTAMKYPLDYRRYEHRNLNVQSDNKQPKFYSSLRLAYDQKNSITSGEEIIIIKCEYFSPPKNHGDYYPFYVITLRA